MALRDHVESDDWGLPSEYPGENPEARQIRLQTVREYERMENDKNNPGYNHAASLGDDIPEPAPLRWATLCLILGLAMILDQFIYQSSLAVEATTATVYGIGYMTLLGTAIGLGVDAYLKAKSKSTTLNKPMSTFIRF